MKRSDFFYSLPDELIAQTPLEPRDSSRLMRINRETGAISHTVFRDIPQFLHPGDLLVVNDSRVIPARLYGVKENTGAAIEFLLLEQKTNNEWEIICKPAKKAKPGAVFVFGDGPLKAEILEILEDGKRLVKLMCDQPVYQVLDQIGQMPLPPYITEELKDRERYQTVYSEINGSAAAPTAGLHFTPELMRRLEEQGVQIAHVTLHVGLGTFRPVKADEITDHKMHSEAYMMSKETADLIRQTKQNGGRVIAVGTTSCRTLESVFSLYGEARECSGSTSIFIYPGYEFKCIDGLITNFHLPESTLIMLVSAFLGYEKTMDAYRTAVKEKYRFFSFGDAMLIL